MVAAYLHGLSAPDVAIPNRRDFSMTSITAPRAGNWAERPSPRQPAAVGLLLIALGSAVMLLLQTDSPVWSLLRQKADVGSDDTTLGS